MVKKEYREPVVVIERPLSAFDSLDGLLMLYISSDVRVKAPKKTMGRDVYPDGGEFRFGAGSFEMAAQLLVSLEDVTLDQGNPSLRRHDLSTIQLSGHLRMPVLLSRYLKPCDSSTYGWTMVGPRAKLQPLLASALKHFGVTEPKDRATVVRHVISCLPAPQGA